MACYELLSDVHCALPEVENFQIKKIETVKGSYEYWHYGCDGVDDRGYGCGYRTLQTICSWLKTFKNSVDQDIKIPSIAEIQNLLVEMEDKPQSMVGSRDWIGSFEACLIIDRLYDVPSKILHISSGNFLENQVDAIFNHFHKFGSPIMMGGDMDCISKGVFGIAKTNANQHFLLILDPHYYGKPLTDTAKLYDQGWVSWKPIKDFMNGSFYNMCMPQISPPDVAP